MPFRAGIEVIIIPDRKRENDNQRAIYPKMVAMYQKSSSIAVFALILAAILLGGGVVWHGAASVHAQTAPILSFPSGLSVQEGETVTVPIAFEANGNAIAAMAFSIDYDERCLALDLTDEDTNGVPDSVTFDLPAGIFASLTPDLDDADGELDFIIADYFPPFVTLQDSSALLTLTFNTICMPPDGNQVEAAIRFSASPSASFGGPQGNSLTGITIDGMVTIVSNVPPTPTHTPTPSATATPTIVPTEPPTTPTATPTFVPTAPPQTIVDYFEAQSQQDGVMLKWKTSQEVNTRSFTVHRLTLGQTGGFAQLTGERASQGTGGSQYTYFDNSIEPATTYTYLLVEEKMNGRRIAYYDLIATVDPVIGTGNQPADRRILLPLIMK